MTDSQQYLAKKALFDQMLTVYGRNPVLEALQHETVLPYRLHLADSNKPSPQLRTIEQLATNAGAEVLYHDRKALARISRNGKQDQGVALDIRCPNHQTLSDFLSAAHQRFELIALDRITNPQNLGMIIRSVCASGCSGLLLPNKGCAKLDALVIKASAGTLFRAPILRCDDLQQALANLRDHGADVYALSSHATHTLHSVDSEKPCVFVLGNETEGVSEPISQLCNESISIPMHNGVESLNVAVTASLLAFRSSWQQAPPITTNI